MVNSSSLLKALLATMLLIFASGVYAAGSVSVIYGNKSLDKGDWEPIEDQSVMGFGLTYEEEGWPVAFVVSYLTGEDSTTASGYDPYYGYITVKATGGTTELAFGARSYLSSGGPRFFIEGGLANITADIKATISGVGSGSDSGSAIGFWFGAGVDVMLSKEISLGAFARMSNATVDISGINIEAGGTHLNVFAAYHF